MSFARPCALLLALALPATAQADYLDDRSTPATLVTSLYNAISGHEYARAWSYFAEGSKPVSDFDSFSAGYANTGRVEVMTGAVTTEGTAGSIYGTVPVAIAAEQSGGGGVKVFGGCYVTRMAQPTIQGVPYTPLQIIKGKLEPRDGSLAEALPAGCSSDGVPEY